MEQIASLFPISEKRQRELFLLAKKEVTQKDLKLSKEVLKRWKEISKNLKNLELYETVHFTLYLIDSIKHLEENTV